MSSASPSDIRRLPVFKDISESFLQPPSRLLCVSYSLQDPMFSEMAEVMLTFGPLQELVQERDVGEVLARYFDLRHTKQAARFLSEYARVDFLPDEVSDCVAVPNKEKEALERILTRVDAILSIKKVGLFLVAQFFDLRIAISAVEELIQSGTNARLVPSGLENPYSDISDDSSYNSKRLTGSAYQQGASIGSDLTLASPCRHPSSSVHSGSSSSYADSSREDQAKRKPRKKHIDEEERALYILDPQKILEGLDSRTTVMIKNIPNKYTQQMLLTTIDRHFANTYDFFYLPIDFKNKCNVGYAFVNFLDSTVIPALYREMNGNKWEEFKSEKICTITYARIQGRAALIQHFQSSSVMTQEDAKIKPLLFPLTAS